MFFATNIADFLACQHIATLERAEKAGEIKRKHYADPGAELLRKLGLEHEQKYLKELVENKGLKVVEIPTDVAWSEAAVATREAMARGAEAIYQATFMDGSDDTSDDTEPPVSHNHPRLPFVSSRVLWGGRADFLLKVETPSKLGQWSYEAVETKLAKSTKARAIIQLCFYSDLVARVQGLEPKRMHVVLGGGAEAEEFHVQRYLAYFRKVRREFQTALAAEPVTYPEPVEHCAVCEWFPNCDERRHVDDHLSLVASITSNQRKALVERDVKTLAQLATLPLPGSEVRSQKSGVRRIAAAPLLRIREQARVQMRGRTEKRPVHELLEPLEAGRGLAALPLPSPGDLFLDFEGDPFAYEQGLEYLVGMVTGGNFEFRISDFEIEGKENLGLRNGDFERNDKELAGEDVGLSEKKFEIRNPQPEIHYEALWAFNPREEKRAFEQFIAKVMERRRQSPGMHIYHYAPYETTAIKHLSGRHGICADEVDELLRAEVFVDLFRVVRQGLRASVESYSIKRMEQFYAFKRTVPLRDATSSLQAFETVLALGDNPEDSRETLRTIEEYNRDDCLSAWHLRAWLEGLRSELEGKLGRPIERPEPKLGAPGDELAAELGEITILKERLLAGLPEEESEWTNEQRACWLLAQMLEWHRREDKSMWWEYYRLCELSDDELVEDKNALGGLTYLRVVDETKRSFIHRYQFPLQDHTIDRALNVHDPRTAGSAGTIVQIDELNLTIDLKREKTSEKPHPLALIPNNYVGSKKQVESLMRIAKWVVENGLNPEAKGDRCGQFQAARDALLRREPRIAVASIETLTAELSPLEAAKRLALALDCSILPIQGPPGSGKTYTGAQMIIELVKAGKRVGITAGSHKVISNLLSTICEAAAETNTKLRIVQKPNEGDGCEHESVTQTDDNAKVIEKLQSGEAQIAAGTPWLWSREEFAGSVDVLFVDEAGQMSLANVLAVSPAAKSVVLLGDPRQLDQPLKGVHPRGAELSALAHLLDGRATIGPDQGLFLSETWRLNPAICEFTSEVFYDGRLTSRQENSNQRLNCRGVPPWPPQVAEGALTGDDATFANAKDPQGDETVATLGRPRRSAPTTLLDGTGLRYVPVIHSGNQSDSPEEVQRIVEIVRELFRGETTWTNKEGETVPLQLKDILIVAPYNAQVLALKEALPGATVGTVDKFQGQQAPVVFYSMATSTPEDAPRGMEFLYSSNRLNVATSRAQCVTILVASPALFQMQCKTLRQIELANAFCRYLEMAKLQ